MYFTIANHVKRPKKTLDDKILEQFSQLELEQLFVSSVKMINRILRLKILNYSKQAFLQSVNHTTHEK